MQIVITELKAVYLSETEQGFHVFGTLQRPTDVLTRGFAFATDDVGHPMLKNWAPAGWTADDRAAVLQAVEDRIITDGQDLEGR